MQSRKMFQSTMVTIWSPCFVIQILLLIFNIAVNSTAFLIRAPRSSEFIRKKHYITTSHNTMVINQMKDSNSFMDRLSNESDDEYFKRIMNIASNPDSFANAVLKQQTTDSKVGLSTSLTDTNNTTSTITNSTTGDVSKPKYVRAEDWDAEERRKASSGSWEERVQYDGQLYGNRYQQNEILRKNLKGF